RWREGGHKLNFDLHRSGGVWIWGLLLVLAVTSVSMNLERQVMRPILQSVSTLTAGPFDTRTPSAPDKVPEPRISREEAVELGRAQ
ncbi:PepSY-associated TM helix domain-containing protein, partial [Acinetobacter baumannii]